MVLGMVPLSWLLNRYLKAAYSNPQHAKKPEGFKRRAAGYKR
jgi:hypothetical protein